MKLHNVSVNWRSNPFMKIAIVFGSVCVFGAIFGFAIFPAVLRIMLGKHVALKPGSEIREVYTKLPFAITVKIYVFNLTNAADVTKGAKPIVQEIGPYIFDEFKEKYDMVDNDVEDSLEYRMTNTLVFRPDLTVGLTGDEIITTVHPLLMGMALAVNVDKKPFLKMTATAIKHMFHNPATPFWTGRAMDLLFDGIDIDCSSEHFAVRSTCGILSSGDVKAIQIIDRNHLKFSSMGGSNATSLGVYKVHRGVRDYRDVGRMISFNGETELDNWSTDSECNQLHGTDSSIFPPGLTPSDGLWAFEPSLCRSFGASYVGPSKYDGIPTSEYTLEFGDAKKDKDLQCLCMSSPDKCPRPGTIDLFQCVGTPMVISMPHFYKADPAILQQFAGGLRPNKKEHNVFIHFEHLTGSPLSAARRLQFSLDVVPVPDVECMQSLPAVLMPMFWMEESVHLNKTYTNELKYHLFLPISVVEIVTWFCIIIGGAGFAIAIYLNTKKPTEASQNTKTVQQEQPPTKLGHPPVVYEKEQTEQREAPTITQNWNSKY